MIKKHLNIQAITISAIMAALSIILERIISITPASNMMDIRISFSNIPIILCGLLVSPLAGALCGAVSDIIGCFISGYPPFPILTAAPFVMGFLPAFSLKFRKKDKTFSFIKIFTVLLITHLISSALITTYGLCVMRGVPFIPMLITRLPSCAVNLAIDTALIYILLRKPFSKML